jgi:hypothetical protein
MCALTPALPAPPAPTGAAAQGESMGFGAFMWVHNVRNDDVLLLISDVECMYDNGSEGSNLEAFNDVIVGAKQYVPSGSGSQYIEAKNSGGCWGVTSKFTLKAYKNSDMSAIGHINFTEGGGAYKSDTSGDMSVDIDNSAAQARIHVTVA